MPENHIPTEDAESSSVASRPVNAEPDKHARDNEQSPVDNQPAPADPWYSSGLRFECTQCGDCCTGEPGAVWVTTKELEDISTFLNKSIGEVRLLHTKLIHGKWSLRDYPNGDCVYLDSSTRKCLVYQARPMQCRTWPFWKSNLETKSSWDRTCERCPGAGTGPLHALEFISSRAEKCDV